MHSSVFSKHLVELLHECLALFLSVLLSYPISFLQITAPSTPLNSSLQSARSVCPIWIFCSYVMVQKLPSGSNLRIHIDYLITFLKIHSSVLPIVYSLKKTIISYILFIFLVIYDSMATSVLVIMSWMEVDF